MHHFQCVATPEKYRYRRVGIGGLSFHHARQLTLRVAFLNGVALVKILFTLCQCNLHFGKTPAADEHAEDRKSTRLNSSHVKISYAVFCLQKKNQLPIF